MLFMAETLLPRISEMVWQRNTAELKDYMLYSVHTVDLPMPVSSENNVKPHWRYQVATGVLFSDDFFSFAEVSILHR